MPTTHRSVPGAADSVTPDVPGYDITPRASEPDASPAASRGADLDRTLPSGRDPRAHLIAPTVGTGALMALYLLLRPYGDMTGDPAVAAAAFASPWWVAAHACGALAIASFARLALRLHDVAPGGISAAARWTGLAGAVLVLPYYGAETFGLHAIGARVLAGDPGAFALVEQVRNQPVAIASFGAGLLSLAASGLLTGWVWQRGHDTWRLAAWPLGVGVALILPQFSLPPAGRMAFGVAYAAAAGLLAVASLRSLWWSAGRAADGR